MFIKDMPSIYVQDAIKRPAFIEEIIDQSVHVGNMMKVKLSELEFKFQRKIPVVRVAEAKVLQPETQARMLRRSNLHGFHALEPKKELLHQNKIIVTNGRALDFIIAGLKWKTCLVYLDDVIVFSQNYEDHLIHLDQELTALRGAGVTLHLRKNEFFTDLIKYLEHIIRLDIAAPLYRLRKGTPFSKELEPFSKNEEAANTTLIKSVTEPPVLDLPKP
eukprot:IDg9973t1